MEAPSIVTSSFFFFFLGVLIFLADLGGGAGTGPRVSISLGLHQGSNNMLPATHRKLLHPGTATAEPNRIWGDNKCSKSDIEVSQGPTAPLPSGIPAYIVEIVNTCESGCAISNIHLSCGMFSSARLINTKLFKRLSYNDCLVSDGNPLAAGAAISFQYANTFPYPLSVSSVVCA